MDGKANLPNNPDTANSSSFSSSSSSPPDLLRHVQAALKRHRPIGTMQSNCIRPRRSVLPHRVVSGTSDAPSTEVDMSKSEDLSLNLMPPRRQNNASFGENPEDAPITPLSSITGTSNNAYEDGCNPFNAQGKNQGKVAVTNLDAHASMPSLQVGSQNVDGQKRVQFAIRTNTLAPQEIEWVDSSQPEAPIGFNQDPKHQRVQHAEPDANLRPEGGISSMLPKKTTVTQDNLQQFRNFLSQPATQSSVVGPSCATTTSVHSTSAPMLNSTTRYSHMLVDSGSCVAAEPLRELNANPQPVTDGVVKSATTSLKDTNRMSIDQATTAVEARVSPIDAELEHKESNQSKVQQECMLKETSISKYSSYHDDKSTIAKQTADVSNLQSQAPMPQTSSSSAKLESSKLEKQEKAASSKGSTAARKRTYDPDLFFKVNGKLYQRLGKIGSGGSSEVHKVISSDCKIYALKKIKLKGRDYATACGFCQEIEYLNRLKGKDNIIQLVDYEVTDKALLEEVLKGGSFSNKDGRVKDDGYIYMVLEYGEIDLAHMLSQKWKELDGCNQTIDENWLRFYWQVSKSTVELQNYHYFFTFLKME